MSDNETIIHICWRHFDAQIVEPAHCPTCNSKQQFFKMHEEWYGWEVVCLNCGERWQDGEMCPRPFLRGWRKKNIEYYRNKAIKLGLLPETAEAQP